MHFGDFCERRKRDCDQANCDYCEYGSCTNCSQGNYLLGESCMLCDESCLTCDPLTGTCLSCPDGYFFKYDNCEICPPLCKTCSSESSCLSCYDDSRLVYEEGIGVNCECLDHGVRRQSSHSCEFSCPNLEQPGVEYCHQKPNLTLQYPLGQPTPMYLVADILFIDSCQPPLALGTNRGAFFQGF